MRIIIKIDYGNKKSFLWIFEAQFRVRKTLERVILECYRLSAAWRLVWIVHAEKWKTYFRSKLRINTEDIFSDQCLPKRPLPIHDDKCRNIHNFKKITMEWLTVLKTKFVPWQGTAKYRQKEGLGYVETVWSFFTRLPCYCCPPFFATRTCSGAVMVLVVSSSSSPISYGGPQHVWAIWPIRRRLERVSSPEVKCCVKSHEPEIKSAEKICF